jgi:broad specificity phosphatase PhoE
MKPTNIFLIRHGESTGNVDKTIYETTPDWKVPLTETGKAQALVAAESLYKDISHTSLTTAFYVSPWHRARQTAEIIKTALENKGISIYKYHEDPRLREQDWGNCRSVEHNKELIKERDIQGTFFYRMETGESGADVYDRISTFFDTLHRDYEKLDFPSNVVIVSHGITIRVFLMRFFHWTVEEFELLHNPKNCQIYKMQYDKSIEKYKLITPMVKRTVNKYI